ncbi:MAG TPA: hypothetical protein VGO04_11130 [Ensifer sp.]|uniref:hypothetical protein n=1 Tax=Ensifer sp. TaxID=1872086 RepID=UPI002E10BC27|nr:hypothetical protein [Ensifer sp.]
MTSGEGRDGKDSRPRFTDEEIRLMRLWSVSDVSAARQVSAQIAYFATPAVFGVYGLATGSVVILGVAFVCILLLLAWGLVSSSRDQRNFILMQSVCAKILAMLGTGEEPR